MSLTHSEGLEPGAWKIIAVAILGSFMSNMDSTVVNVSLSFIKQELRSTVASAASRLPVRIHQEADSSKAPIPAPGQLAVRAESA